VQERTSDLDRPERPVSGQVISRLVGYSSGAAPLLRRGLSGLPRERITMTERITVAESLPTTAVVRVSRASYDPNRFAEVDAVSKKTSEYIIPAVRRLPGLIHFYAGISPKGSIVQVSIWDTDEHAAQLDRLKEVVVDGRRDMEAVGVTFTPIFNYPIDWTWTV
jgi:hypothetical protein